MKALIIAVSVLMLVIAATPVSAEKKVVFSQFVHRHGARTALVGANSSTMCGSWGCGELTIPGRAQLTALGMWLRNRYTSGADPIFPQLQSQAYDQRKVWSRSTDISRTIQSADSVLRGIFPDLSQFYPIIHSFDFATDVLLHIEAQLSYLIPLKAGKVPAPALPESFYTAVSHHDLGVMAAEANLTGWCGDIANDQKQYTMCALACQDVCMSKLAEGLLGLYPMLQQHCLGPLSQMRFDWNYRLYAYDRSDDTQRQRGSLGWILADKLLYNIGKYQEAAAKGESYPALFEYSAHDTTLEPLAATLGHDNLMLPAFGQALVLELTYDAAANESYVDLWSGGPRTQYPVSTLPSEQFDPEHYAYNMTQLAVYCLPEKASTTPVAVTDGTCTLEGFTRYIKWTQPESDAGNCYLSKDVRKAIDCEGTGAATNEYCKLFRRECPHYGCPPKHVVNFDNLSCVPTHVTPIVSKAAAVIIAIAAFAAGAVLALAIKVIIMVVLRNRQKEKGEEYAKVH